MLDIHSIEELYNNKITVIREWIFNLLNKYEQHKVLIHSKAFKSLPDYFNEKLLKNTFSIYVKDIPIIPFDKMGLDMYSELETKKFVGITYLNCFFINEKEANNESLHFHELIHVLQWKFLGIDKFLFCYALGLLEHGYRRSPLEVMAYSHQSMFEAGEVYDVEQVIMKEMQHYVGSLRKYNIFTS